MALSRMEERLLKRIALDYDMQYIWSNTRDSEIIAAPGEGQCIYVVFLTMQSDAASSYSIALTDADGTVILGRWYETHDKTGCVSFPAPVRLPVNAALHRLDESGLAGEMTDTWIHVQYFVGPFKFDN